MKEKKYRFWQIWMKVAVPVIIISLVALYQIFSMLLVSYIIIRHNRISEIGWELSEELSVEKLSGEPGRVGGKLDLEHFNMVAVVYDQEGNIVEQTDVESYTGDDICTRALYREMLKTISTQQGNYGQQESIDKFGYTYTYGSRGIGINSPYSVVYAGVTAPWLQYGEKFSRIGIVLLAIVILITYLIARSYYKIYAARMKMEDYYRFTANALAHDLKTPLMVISGYAENLLENVHNEKREHYARTIVNNVADMNHMVEGMLLFTDSNNNNCTLQKEPVNFRQATEAVLEKYQAVLEKKEISISVQGEVTVQAGKQQMNRVFDNLIGNAVKFTPSHERIEIVMSEQEYHITNTGISFPKRKIKQLWKPFEKIDQSRSGVSGNGLGLAIVKEILDQHHFTYQLYSEENSVTVRIGIV